MPQPRRTTRSRTFRRHDRSPDQQPQRPQHNDNDLPEIDGKWPAWKVTTLVILFCGAFWTGVVMLAMRLFGG